MVAFKCCLFDLDGTLLDTAPEMLAVVNQVLSQENRTHINDKIIAKFMAVGSMDFINYIYPTTTSTELAAKKKHFFLSYLNHINNATNYKLPELFSGIYSLLNFLKEKNVPWGIVTNRPRMLTKHLVAPNGLLKDNRIVICPEDVTKKKPDPEGLLTSCKFMGYKPQNCIYIGDHANDITAGNLANMFTVAASYGYIAADDNPNNWRADICIQHPDELISFFQTNNFFI